MDNFPDWMKDRRWRKEEKFKAAEGLDWLLLNLQIEEKGSESKKLVGSR